MPSECIFRSGGVTRRMGLGYAIRMHIPFWRRDARMGLGYAIRMHIPFWRRDAADAGHPGH
jgi:hypothetical protein